MAKPHVYEMLAVWIGKNQQTLQNQIVRLRTRAKFTCKHDGDAVSSDYNVMLDLEMGYTRFVEFVLKTIVIHLQNKKLRPMTRANALKWIKEHDPVKFDDIYKGHVVKRAMTEREMMLALLAKYEGDVDKIKNELGNIETV